MQSKKESILSTALNQFVTNGYENTPTASISRMSGVATGTLFHHFKNKQEILDQLYMDCKLSLKNQIVAGLSSAKDPKSKLFIMWQNYVRWATRNPDQFYFLDTYSEHTLISKGARDKVDNTYSELLELIGLCKESGLLANLPIEYLIMLTQLHFAASAKYCITHPKTLGKKKLPKRLFQAFWHAITAPKAD